MSGSRAGQEVPDALERIAQSGCPVAQVTLGYAFLTGERVGQNPSAASRWLTAAAEQGDALAMRLLALGVPGRASTPISDEEAQGWAEVAAGLGDPKAAWTLVGRAVGSEEVEERLISAARSGVREAQAAVARTCLELLETRADQQLRRSSRALMESADAMSRVIGALALATDIFARPSEWTGPLDEALEHAELEPRTRKLAVALAAPPDPDKRVILARLRELPDPVTLIWDGPWSQLERTRRWVASKLVDESPNSCSAVELGGEWHGSRRSLSLVEASLLATSLDGECIGMAPDPRVDGHWAMSEDAVVFFGTGRVGPPAPSIRYATLQCLCRAATMVAIADEQFSPLERRWIEAFIDSGEDLDELDLTRLKSYGIHLFGSVRSMIADPYYGLRLPREEYPRLRDVAVQTAASDGVLADAERGFLRHLYEALGLQAESAPHDVFKEMEHHRRHGDATAEAPLEASTSVADQGYENASVISGDFQIDGRPKVETDDLIVARVRQFGVSAPSGIMKAYKLDMLPDGWDRWEQECAARRSLSQTPWTPRLLSQDWNTSVAWLVWENEGESLNEYMQSADENGATRLTDASQVTLSILECIQSIGSIVTHGNLNPDSVLLRRSMTVSLIDFDHCHRWSEDGTAVRVPLKTGDPGWRFASPEVREGHVVRREAADVWSAACLCIWMITGQAVSEFPRLTLDGTTLDSAEGVRGLLQSMLSDAPADRPTADEAIAGWCSGSGQ